MTPAEREAVDYAYAEQEARHEAAMARVEMHLLGWFLLGIFLGAGLDRVLFAAMEQVK